MQCQAGLKPARVSAAQLEGLYRCTVAKNVPRRKVRHNCSSAERISLSAVRDQQGFRS
jgi:hypothetical protein